MALLVLALRDPLPTASVAARIPWWAWSGGLFGALFIGLAILLVPQLGAATFFALLVTGQMLASLTFDHVGMLGVAQRPVDLPRLLGVALLIGGVVPDPPLSGGHRIAVSPGRIRLRSTSFIPSWEASKPSRR